MKFKSNWNIFIPENALENVIYEISAILSKGICVESNVHMRKWINILYIHQSITAISLRNILNFVYVLSKLFKHFQEFIFADLVKKNLLCKHLYENCFPDFVQNFVMESVLQILLIDIYSQTNTK